ncbi:MAG: NapC/NirT family cytochrome c [Deltaproteobacteria bacterium]|nr:NapC/NirT family cytochrome c [Deltaproteobacteria bacterium]
MTNRVSSYFKRHKIVSVGAVIIIVVWLLSNTIFLALSGNPKTCASCHIMQPYINEWKTSVHSGVKCTTCHDLGFNYFTRLEFQTLTGMYNPHPVAVVKDSACLKCHPHKDISKPVFYKNMVYFDHAKHVGKSVREMLLTCETCHPSVTHGSHMKVVDEDACISCHFIGAPRGEAITGCPSCHGSPTKTVDLHGMTFNHKSYLTKGMQCNQCHLDVIKGKGSVPRDRCHECHEDRSYKYDNPVFVHNTHVTKEHLTCDKCHRPMYHGEIHMIQALESNCTDCHQDRHNYQREMYMGIGATDTTNMPDSMFLSQVSCEGCHPNKIRTNSANQNVPKVQSLRETAHACVECHGRPYDRLMYNWIAVGNGMLNYVNAAIARTNDSIDRAGISSARKAQAKKLLSAAIFNRQFVSFARPSHNIRYTQQILLQSLDLANRASRLAGAGSIEKNRPPSLESVGASCAVLCHGTLGMPGTVRFKTLGVDFPHDFHVNMGMDCAACHPTDHTMAMDIKIDTCAGCHHQNKSTSNCTLCHSSSAALYSGDVPFSDVPHTPNVMSGSVGCADCHAHLEHGKIYTDVKKRCIDCHVPAYGNLLDKWNSLYVGKYDQAELLLKNTSIKLEGMDKNTVQYKREKARYDDASAKLAFLEKANGLHNIMVTDRMLDGIITELK